MAWLKEIFADPTAVESSLLILALVIALGLMIGSVSFRGIRLGVAGILFSGLAFGHFGLAPNATVLSFAREFGLVLFVFSVGLSVGPGFFNSLRKQGLSLNLLAVGVVLLGVAVTVLWMTVAGLSGPIAVGLFCGATTNTPSLAAAGQALRDHPPGDWDARAALAQVVPDHPLLRAPDPPSDADREQLLAEIAKLPGMAYAVSYPGGVIGIIIAILTLRWIFRVDPVAEAQEYEANLTKTSPRLEKAHVRVTNLNLIGLHLAGVPAWELLGVIVSRVIRGREEFVATPRHRLAAGDILLVVGTADALQQFVTIVGERTEIEAAATPSQIQVRWITVSRKDVAGRTVGELALGERFGVQLTRIRRAGIELPPMHDVALSLGDEIRIVGLPGNITHVAQEMGDSPRRLGEPELLPVFIGIALGVLIGSIPLSLPGIPGAVKLGLAGGPLLIAIYLSRRQRIGPVAWYLPRSANLMLKDLGISVFLASIGLKSGDLFVDTFLNGTGLWWLVAGAVITLLPLLVVGIVAHKLVGERFLDVIGLLAGSMTDPPALAFANSLAGSEIPSVAYATVYPLTMILRVIAAQLLMMYWSG
jgi:putative transport protein